MVKTKKYLASVQKNRNKSIKRNKKSLRLNKKSLRRNKKSLRRNKKSLKGGKSIRRNRSKRRQFKKTKIQTGGSFMFKKPPSPLSFLLELDPANCTKIKGIYFLWNGSKGLSIVRIYSLDLKKNKVNYGERTDDSLAKEFLNSIKFVIIETKKPKTTLITNCLLTDEQEVYNVGDDILDLSGVTGLFKFTFNTFQQKNYFLTNTLNVSSEVSNLLMYIGLSKPKDGVLKCFFAKNKCIMKIEVKTLSTADQFNLDFITIQEAFNKYNKPLNPGIVELETEEYLDAANEEEEYGDISPTQRNITTK